MKKSILAVALTFAVSQSAMADFFNMRVSDSISDDADAKNKCPAACTMTWNGNWVTTKVGKMSICSLDNEVAKTTLAKQGGIEAGPIWSNSDAENKCKDLAKKVSWNGNWTRFKLGDERGAVCGCDGGKPSTWTPNNIDSSAPSEAALNELDLASGAFNIAEVD